MARGKASRAVLPVLVAAGAALLAAACSGRSEWFPDRELHYRRNPAVSDNPEAGAYLEDQPGLDHLYPVIEEPEDRDAQGGVAADRGGDGVHLG